MTDASPPAPTLIGRRFLVTGSGQTPDRIANALSGNGAQVARMQAGFSSENAVRRAVASAEAALGGLDAVLHAWLPDTLLVAADFAGLDEQTWQDNCESTLAGAWWLARQSIPSLQRSRGSLTFLVPTLGMSGGARFVMLAAVAEGIRGLAKSCGRQFGTAGVTVNTVATAAHLWLSAADADAVTAATTLSTPDFGRFGDADADIAPLVAMLSQPEAHFLTAATVVADGGVWMGL